MFIEKLWLRIKGELITLRRELLSEGEMREKALNVLEKLEKSLRESGAEIASTDDSEKKLEEIAGKLEQYSSKDGIGSSSRVLGDKETPTARELRQAYDELKKSRDAAESGDSENHNVRRNPRKLG